MAACQPARRKHERRCATTGETTASGGADARPWGEPRRDDIDRPTAPVGRDTSQGRPRDAARRHRLDLPAARVWHRHLLAGPARGAAGADGVSAVDLVAIVRGGDADQAPEVVARIHQDQRGEYAAAARVLERRATTSSSSNTSTASSAGRRRAHPVARLRAAPADGPHAAHRPVGAVGAAGRDVARPLRPGRARLRLHRDGPPDDPRRPSGVARARPRRSARWPDRAASRARAATAARRNPGGREDRPRSPRDRCVLATFGLISPGKGIEMAIAAMPAIVARHPNALYVIAGQTHPEVAKLHGEEYRISLERLARDLDLRTTSSSTTASSTSRTCRRCSRPRRST